MRGSFFQNELGRHYINGRGWTHLWEDIAAPLEVLCVGGYDVNEVLLSYTPLNVACTYDRLDFVRWLLRNGADPNFGQIFDPLYTCVTRSAYGCAKALLCAGAVIDRHITSFAFSYCDKLDMSSHKAVFLLMLLDRGAELKSEVPNMYTRYYERRRNRRIALRVLGACLCARVATKDTRRLMMKNCK